MFGQKKLSFFVIVVFLLVISACTKVNPAEDIYTHLEAAVSLEAPFEAQQVPLSEAENKEYELYNEILKLSDLDEIRELVAETEELANSRKAMIEKEKDSINEAYDEFLLIEPIIGTIEKEELRNLANELVNTMKNRYEAYMDLYNEYKVAIDLDMDLYQLILKEDLTIEELETQHDKVNASYQQVNDLKDKFNEYTLEYNDLKREFYSMGGLDVVYN